MGIISDTTNLATKDVVDAIRAKTDNLPDDPASQTVILLALANIAGDVWDYTERSLTEPVLIDADSLHEGLDSWERSLSIPTADDALDCRVYLYIGGQSAAVIPDAVDKATAKIVRLPYRTKGRFFAGQGISGTYDKDSGLLSWSIIRGASVLIEIPILGFRKEISVPDGESFDLSLSV